MTKDRDFLHLLFEQGPPPQVIRLWPTFVRVSPGWKFARPSETGCIRCLGSSHREGVLWHHEAHGSRVLLFVPEQRKQDGRAGDPSGLFSVSGHGISSGPDQLQLAERSASKAAAHPGNGSR